ncbi:MAG: hypothetical protein ACREET_15725, partial [Stellaceae bacterium]
ITLVAGAEAERDLGNLDAAKAASRESQKIIEQLRVVSAHQPQFGHDLAALEARATALLSS